jgi:RluA family pseudouridine synthase
LDDVTGEWLAQVLGRAPSRAAVRRLIMGGGLCVRGRPLRAPGRPLEAGTPLEATVEDALLRLPEAPPPLDTSRILYEDAALIAIDKPPGLPTVATADRARPHLVRLVERLLARRPGAPPRPYLGVHQRLDRDTSGIVLFTKDPAANEGLAAQFAERSVEKTYLALTVRGATAPPQAWRDDREIDAAGGRSSAGARPQSAVTDFRLLEALPRGLLIEARPRTGRKHQIRIHLAGAGRPILGDVDYGAPKGVAGRVMLHAARLSFRHPITGAVLSVTCPPPADFRRALESLRRAAAAPPRGRRPR